MRKELIKPEMIDFGDQIVPTNEIAAVHQQSWNSSYYVLFTDYKAQACQIKKDHAAYKDVQALYNYLHHVWIEEDSEAITFYAYDSAALGVLYEILERDHYSFLPRHIGSGVLNEIVVYRNQGDDIDAMDRERGLSGLVEDFRTDKEEV